jgi:glutamyl-tRNA synthetase
LLHLGHARTFWTAQARARERGGALVFRNEDLDRDRCRPEFVDAMFEDLRWFGLRWDEGPDCGGPHAPYAQSERLALYRAAFERLRAGGFVYACTCSRRDVQRALQAPHAADEEPIYPGTCRPKAPGCPGLGSGAPVSKPARFDGQSGAGSETGAPVQAFTEQAHAGRVNWRFRVPDGARIEFHDALQGPQAFTAGTDFGDFVVWRHDGVPAYQLAVVVDDEAMRITEVVRGADLLVSTARQVLLYRALGLEAPGFCHGPLVTDAAGARLAKRHDALSLRALRERGVMPEALRAEHPFSG